MIFVLDTSVLWRRRVRDLAELAKKHNHKVEIPALVHAERIAQVRRDKGRAFDLSFIDSFLKTHEVEIVSFDREIAERSAQELARRFPTPEAWHSARRQRCETRFQLASSATAPICPATIDWYISASYSDREIVLVTEDKGPEFVAPVKLSLDEAIQAAERN